MIPSQSQSNPKIRMSGVGVLRPHFYSLPLPQQPPQFKSKAKALKLHHHSISVVQGLCHEIAEILTIDDQNFLRNFQQSRTKFEITILNVRLKKKLISNQKNERLPGLYIDTQIILLQVFYILSGHRHSTICIKLLPNYMLM